MSDLERERTLITEIHPKSPVSEAYRKLRTNIDFSNVQGDTRSIVITSSRMAEGKSTTISNLAVAYAQASKNVLLVDADLRKPILHRIFGVSNRSGLTSVLSHQDTLQETIRSTPIDNLSLLTSGQVPPNPAEMLASKRMAELIEDMERRFDMVLFDTPPLLAVTDAQLVASRADGVILVVESGKVKKDMVLKAKQALEHAQARILGVVLNNVARSKKDSYGYYYY